MEGGDRLPSWLGEKKGLVIRDWILHKVQSQIINDIMVKLNVSKELVAMVNVLTNIDKLSFVQFAILKLGGFRFVAGLIYLLVFA